MPPYRSRRSQQPQPSPHLVSFQPLSLSLSQQPHLFPRPKPLPPQKIRSRISHIQLLLSPQQSSPHPPRKPLPFLPQKMLSRNRIQMMEQQSKSPPIRSRPPQPHPEDKSPIRVPPNFLYTLLYGYPENLLLIFRVLLTLENGLYTIIHITSVYN